MTRQSLQEIAAIHGPRFVARTVCLKFAEPDPHDDDENERIYSWLERGVNLYEDGSHFYACELNIGFSKTACAWEYVGPWNYGLT